MKIGIIGYGHVGKAMHSLFKDAVIYDKHLKIGSIDKVNDCNAAFICVPTPMNVDGSCDTSIVEEVIMACKCNVIIIRSTVRIGFTREIVEKTSKHIVFQPEYYGETVAHPYSDLKNQSWLSFGGEQKAIDLAIQVYQKVINSNIHIYQAPSDEVEMAKYMENAFLATKVIFCNEMNDICEKMGLNYNIVREIWTADPRIGKSHTFVFKDNKGFGGSCLPKDIASLKKQAEESDVDTTLIDSVIDKNKKYKTI